MKTRLFSVTPSRAALLLGALLSSLCPALAATHGRWATTQNGGWGAAQNWVGGAIADGPDATATFDTAISATTHVGVDAGRTVGHIVFNSKQQWQLTGSKLTLAVSGIDESPTITVNNGHPFVWGIAGTQGFVKRGGSNLYLVGDNTYTGVTYVAGGQLYVSKDLSLGATGAGNNTVVSHTAQLHFSRNVSVEEEIVLFRPEAGEGNAVYNDDGVNVLGGGLTLQRGGTSDRSHTFGIQVSAGTLVAAGPVTGKLTPGAAQGVAGADSNILRIRPKKGATMDITGAVSDGDIGEGGVSVHKIDAGVLRLSAANGYSGSTIVDAGFLLVNNTRGSGTGKGSVLVNAGGSLGGVGALGPAGRGNITVAAGGVVAPGSLNAKGESIAAAEKLVFGLGATTGRLSFQAGASLEIDLNPSVSGVSERLVFTGLAQGKARVHLNDNAVNFTITGGTLAPGLYTVAAFDAADAYSGRLLLGTGLEAYEAALLHNPENIQLRIVRKL